MTLERKQDRRPQIDLTGPEGNAFCLLGYASQYAKQLGLDGEKIRREMKAGDYDHLVHTFDKYFGQYVTLYYAGEDED